jgi:hypothetical protein
MTIHGVTPLLQVFNMPRSVAFYRDVLGFAVIHTSEPGEQFDWAMLKRGDAVLMLNTAYESHERPSAPDPERVAAHADTTRSSSSVARASTKSPPISRPKAGEQTNP